MIALPTPGPRLYIELGMAVLIVLLASTNVATFALWRGAKSEATEQLSVIASKSAELTAAAVHTAYEARMRQIEEDRVRSDLVAKDAVTRARKAETALNSLRRDLNAEALEDACVGRPLSERTRERLRGLEAAYPGGDGQVRAGPGPK